MNPETKHTLVNWEKLVQKLERERGRKKVKKNAYVAKR